MKYSKILLLGAALAACCGAKAQDSKSGYFLDDYTYRYQLNPAFANSRGFVAMPAIGNFGLGLNGTLGIDDVLYNVDGRTTTFLNPKVSTKEALKNIGDMNRFGFDLKVGVLNFGFKGFGGYNTIGLNMRSSLGLKVPGSVFRMLKEGIANKTYEIANFKGYANAWAELQLGHSRNITPEIRVGANVKFLVGAGNADFNLKKANMVLGENEWRIESEADINLNVKGLRYETEISDNTGNPYVNGIDGDDMGVGGFGVAFDLGAVYKPSFLPDFEFSAALLDLGFIRWNSNIVASTNGVKYFTTADYTFNVDDDAFNNFDDEIDRMTDKLATLYELNDNGDKGSQTRALGATMNLGVLYTLPYYRGLKFGLLNTTHIQSIFSWTDFRLSANILPCKVFDASANLSMGTFGVGFGWIANFHAPGFNLFVGMDRTLGKLAKPGVPMNANAHVNLGINFLIK